MVHWNCLKNGTVFFKFSRERKKFLQQYTYSIYYNDRSIDSQSGRGYRGQGEVDNAEAKRGRAFFVYTRDKIDSPIWFANLT